MATKSKATKAVIASLLATSAIVPAMAVSAEVGSVTPVGDAVSTTAVGAKTIDFKVDVPAGQEILKNFVKGPGTLLEQDGKKYIQLNLAETELNMLSEVLVDGKSAILNYGTKMVAIPVSDDFKPVEVKFTIDSPFAKGEYTATIVPDASSIKDPSAVTAPTTPVEVKKPFSVGKTFGQVADGTYDVTYDAYAPETNIGNYSSMLRHLAAGAKLVVEGGKYKLQITVAAGSNSMIKGFKLNDKEGAVVAGSMDGDTQVFEFEIDSISELHDAKIHVYAPAANMDKEYPFGLAINTADLNLPELSPVYVYKDDTNELSIMHNKYLDDEVTVTSTETGYDVILTFPEGQYINNFKFAGSTVAKTSSETVGENTVKIYTVSVKNLIDIYTATIDLSVKVGDFSYDNVYDVQLQFGGKKNPFTDIQKSWAKGFIADLYAKGIFKEDTKFNPTNNTQRYQFALMLQRAMNLEVPTATKFTDLPTDAEAVNAIKALNHAGVIRGIEDTKFNPNGSISRQDTAIMIHRLLKANNVKDVADAKTPFTDVKLTANSSAYEKEAAAAITQLYAHKIINGETATTFAPTGTLMREAMAKILVNTLEVLGK